MNNSDPGEQEPSDTSQTNADSLQASGAGPLPADKPSTIVDTPSCTEKSPTPNETHLDIATPESPVPALVREDISQHPQITIESFKVLEEKLDTLQNLVSTLAKEFENKLKFDRHRETVIDNLHKELQEYRRDPIKKVLRPVLMDIICLIDNTTKLVKHHRSKDKMDLDPMEVLGLLESIPLELEEILFRQGVEAFTSPIGSKHDPGCHNAFKTMRPDDETQNKTIAESLRNGYRWEGKILRPELVSVYIYDRVSKLSEEQISESNKEKEE